MHALITVNVEVYHTKLASDWGMDIEPLVTVQDIHVIRRLWFSSSIFVHAAYGKAGFVCWGCQPMTTSSTHPDFTIVISYISLFTLYSGIWELIQIKD